MNDLPTSAMGVMRLMPSKTTEIATFAKQLIHSVKSGDTNALELFVMLRSLELVSELVREEIGDNVLTEAEKHSENKFNAFGAIVERGAIKTEYLYDTSGDSQWEELDAEIKGLEARRKERQKFLMAIKDPVLLVNKDGAEELVKPPVKRVKEGVKVYLANVK